MKEQEDCVQGKGRDVGAKEEGDVAGGEGLAAFWEKS